MLAAVWPCGVKWFHQTGSIKRIRTAGQVRWAVSVHVVDVLGGGRGHLQVDHLPCVFQDRHSVFMENVLQRHVVHLWGSEVVRRTFTRRYSQAPRRFSYSDYFVPDLQASVTVRRSSLNNLGDVDAVVSRNVLVPHATSDAEAEAWTRDAHHPSLKHLRCFPGSSSRIQEVTLILPLGPFISLIWMMRSLGGRRRRTYSLTTGPASFSASTAMEWVTSRTSTSLTNMMLSFTLEGQKHTTSVI